MGQKKRKPDRTQGSRAKAKKLIAGRNIARDKLYVREIRRTVKERKKECKKIERRTKSPSCSSNSSSSTLRTELLTVTQIFGLWKVGLQGPLFGTRFARCLLTSFVTHSVRTLCGWWISKRGSF
jgi:hypothetical protein